MNINAIFKRRRYGAEFKSTFSLASSPLNRGSDMLCIIMLKLHQRERIMFLSRLEFTGQDVPLLTGPLVHTCHQLNGRGIDHHTRGCAAYFSFDNVPYNCYLDFHIVVIVVQLILKKNELFTVQFMRGKGCSQVVYYCYLTVLCTCRTRWRRERGSHNGTARS